MNKHISDLVVAAEDVISAFVEENRKDLLWGEFKNAGVGGQHVNNGHVSLRLKHIPTGIEVETWGRAVHTLRQLSIIKLMIKMYDEE